MSDLGITAALSIRASNLAGALNVSKELYTVAQDRSTNRSAINKIRDSVRETDELLQHLNAYNDMLKEACDMDSAPAQQPTTPFPRLASLKVRDSRSSLGVPDFRAIPVIGEGDEEADDDVAPALPKMFSFGGHSRRSNNTASPAELLQRAPSVAGDGVKEFWHSDRVQDALSGVEEEEVSPEYSAEVSGMLSMAMGAFHDARAQVGSWAPVVNKKKNKKKGYHKPSKEDIARMKVRKKWGKSIGVVRKQIVKAREEEVAAREAEIAANLAEIADENEDGRGENDLHADISNMSAEEAAVIYEETDPRVRLIIAAMEQYFYRAPGGDRWEPWGRAKMTRSLEPMVEKNQEVLLHMLAFPFKFSKQGSAKCIGDCPDLAEQQAIFTLNNLCDAVNEVYEPGARLVVLSDGILWNDLFDVPEETMWAYRRGCEEISAGHSVEFRGLDDFFPDGWSAAQVREALFALCRPHLAWTTEVKKKDVNAMRSYSDFVGFLFNHLAGVEGFSSNSQRQRAASLVANEMLTREQALIRFARTLLPGAIRLSIRPKSFDTGSYTVNLVGPQQQAMARIEPDLASLATPWHNVGVLQPSGEVYLCRLSFIMERPDCFEPIYRDGVHWGYREIHEEPIQESANRFINSRASDAPTHVLDRRASMGRRLRARGEELLNQAGNPGETATSQYRPYSQDLDLKRIAGDVTPRGTQQGRDTRLKLNPYQKEMYLTSPQFKQTLMHRKESWAQVPGYQRLLLKKKAKLLG